MSFAPGHISLTFAIWPDSDLLAMGSTGVGIVLPQGVHCAVVKEQSEIKENVVIRGGSSTEDLVTLRALELLGFKDRGLTVYFRHDLPLGSGFGISGASALAACMELENNLDFGLTGINTLPHGARDPFWNITEFISKNEIFSKETTTQETTIYS